MLAQCYPLQSCQTAKNLAENGKNQPKGEHRQQVQPIVPEKEAYRLGFESQKNKIDDKNYQDEVVYDLDAQFKGMVFNMEK